LFLTSLKGNNLFNYSRTRIDDPNFLVFASGEQLGPIPIPAGGIDQIRVAIDNNSRFPGPCIPNDYQIIGTC
jgi:hypothetical protein